MIDTDEMARHMNRSHGHMYDVPFRKLVADKDGHLMLDPVGGAEYVTDLHEREHANALPWLNHEHDEGGHVG